MISEYLHLRKPPSGHQSLMFRQTLQDPTPTESTWAVRWTSEALALQSYKKGGVKRRDMYRPHWGYDGDRMGCVCVYYIYIYITIWGIYLGLSQHAISQNDPTWKMNGIWECTQYSDTSIYIRGLG
jgi:hypothetical protein